ncbi:RNA-guided endonuclease InsQ/TnpB family protein [Microbispora bryophytorum]|uniref:Transposase n=1 Tax=Microbispora bryophytorum TaxID=1460882 RepID=A0A8H9H1N2_9ACTN|nr:RNA-guided endonuclease TnpB family protein [Microbispora bryophytorum]MBD3136010.1 transposase [Microbispora bryophytorum]TQS07773.1 IS200/IS605 family element transposase accessory protein TnpB [Microbispora bryophytorum]GGO03962.1 transposase [Microbispora bryophytorum]
MRQSFKFLLRPTSKQAASLAACLEDHRQLYNAALEHRRTAYRRAGVTVRYGDQSGELKHIRADDPAGQGRWSFSSQQATLRRLDKAFAAFFKRVREGHVPGFPRFKGRGWFDTVEWPKDGDGCRWDSQPEHPTATFVRLQGIGHVRVHQHRSVRGRVKTISVKREASRWYVVLSCDDVPAQPLASTGAAVGVDMGVVSLVTTSDGERLANPRHLQASAHRLAVLQRDLARTKRGSRRRRKAVARVAALHAKVRRQRLDGAHKAALTLVRSYDVIMHEDLRIAIMTRSASGTIDNPGRKVAQKSGLNRSILDAGWGVFLRVLAHKAESAGRELIAVNPANTSRTCARCGHCARDNRLTQAEFACTSCGHTAHADMNAAINILRAGLALRDAAEAA